MRRQPSKLNHVINNVPLKQHENHPHRFARSRVALARFILLFTIVLISGFSTADETPAQNPDRLTIETHTTSKPKVLILGDSISLGYTPLVKKNLQDIADVSRPSENCQHTAYGLANIQRWLGKEKWNVIHFNWGIWDTHLLDEKGGLIRDEKNFTGTMRIRHSPEQYRDNLNQLVTAMERTGAKLIFATTTPILYRQGPRFDDIPIRNKVAETLMRERHVTINNLYDFVLPHAQQWQSADKVHFNATGNQELAKQVSEAIRATLDVQRSQATTNTR